MSIALSEHVKPHKEGEFCDALAWQCVSSLNWATDPDHHRTKKEVSQMEPAMKEKLWEWCKQKRKDLADVLDRYAASKPEGKSRYWNVSDDGFWDLTAHIVGMGKTFYNAVIEHPQIAKWLADSRTYKENFEYSFHQ